MPTYTYEREDGTTFEAWQNILDKPLKKCIVTGQDCKRIIVDGAKVHFKGGGWERPNR